MQHPLPKLRNWVNTRCPLQFVLRVTLMVRIHAYLRHNGRVEPDQSLE